MKTSLKNAIEYYSNSNTSMTETAKKFEISYDVLRKHLISLNLSTKRVSKRKFILQANLVHNNRYDYSLVEEFKRVKDKVTILCPIHGAFRQDVFSHKKGCGCPVCARKYVGNLKLQTKEDFLVAVKKVHGDIYNYDKTTIQNNTDKVIITCKIHGDFLQSPDKHKRGRGCPTCCLEHKGWSKTTWKNLLKKGDIPKMYIIRCYNTKEEFIKIGRTKDTIKRRFSGNIAMPYKIEILKIIENLDSDFIFDLEIKYKREFKKFKYIPKIYFAGNSECFQINKKEEMINVDLTN